MSRKLLVALAVTAALLTSVTVAQAQEKAGPEALLQKYAQELKPRVEQTLEKAVPRTDKAESTVIGALVFIDGIDFLSDGTPFRILIVESKRPLLQDIPIICLGTSAVNTCGRLPLRRRVSFTSDILVDDDGLAIFVAKRVQT